MRPVQKFSEAYLEQCRQMSTEEIVEFLESFRLLHSESTPKKEKSILISIKVPSSLLTAFKTKARLNDLPYQTQIKKLMKDWLV